MDTSISIPRFKLWIDITGVPLELNKEAHIARAVSSFGLYLGSMEPAAPSDCYTWSVFIATDDLAAVPHELVFKIGGMLYNAHVHPRKYIQGLVFQRGDLPPSSIPYNPPDPLQPSLPPFSTPDPTWLQGEDIIPMSLSALREIFRDFHPSELPPDLAECLAGNTAAIKANHDAYRRWEVQDTERRLATHFTNQQTPPAIVNPVPATVNPVPTHVSATLPDPLPPLLPPPYAPGYRTRNPVDPPTLLLCHAPHEPTFPASHDPTLLLTSQARQPTHPDTGRPILHIPTPPPTSLAHEATHPATHLPSVLTPSTTYTPNHTSPEITATTVSRTDIRDPAPQLYSRAQPTVTVRRHATEWDSQILFPEIFAPPPQPATQPFTSISPISSTSQVTPDKSQLPTPQQPRRTPRIRTNKPSPSDAPRLDVDVREFYDIPLQYAEGRELLNLIGAAAIQIPPHLMSTLQPHHVTPSHPPHVTPALTQSPSQPRSTMAQSSRPPLPKKKKPNNKTHTLNPSTTLNHSDASTNPPMARPQPDANAQSPPAPQTCQPQHPDHNIPNPDVTPLPKTQTQPIQHLSTSAPASGSPSRCDRS